MTDLLPCPFCGEKADLKIKVGVIDGERAVSAVFCMTCGGSGAYAEIQEHAIESWNRRAAPVQPAGLLEEAMSACIEARSALDYLMGDTDLPEDDSDEMTAMQMLSEVIARYEKEKTPSKTPRSMRDAVYNEGATEVAPKGEKP